MSNHKETDRFRQATREQLIESGPYSHVLVNTDYADRLQQELGCDDPVLAQRLGMKHLSIVDGLDDDFVIIP